MSPLWLYGQDLFVTKNDLSPYLPIILKYVLRLVLQKPVRSCGTFKCTKSCRKRQRMFLTMADEYRPCFETRIQNW